MKKRILKTFFVLGILFLFILAPLSDSRAADKFPSRYIELYHGFPPGGAVEIQNRVLAKSLEKHLGVPVVSVSKAGGGGVIGTTALINAPPDGYTAANMSFGSIVQTVLLSNGALSLDDLKVVAQWNIFGAAMCVSPDSQWKTFQALLDHARKNPGTKFAHTGVGNATYLRMENLNRSANLKMIHVPFKGDAEVITALLGKHVPVGVFSAFSAKAQAAAGKLRIIFSFDAPAKFGLDPNIPYIANTFEKSIADKDIEIVGFVIVPRKTPDEIVKILESAMQKACKEPELIDNVEKFGMAIQYFDGKTGTANLRKIYERVKAIQQ
jgi:tripartite-type tricarboxylate transporter receptor subunit TctC